MNNRKKTSRKKIGKKAVVKKNEPPFITWTKITPKFPKIGEKVEIKGHVEGMLETMMITDIFHIHATRKRYGRCSTMIKRHPYRQFLLKEAYP
jgi:hypothetical protein